MTSDLRKWDPAVDDTAYPEYEARPGMTTIAQLPQKRYIMTYEVCGARGGCPLHFRITTDPTKLNSAEDHTLKLFRRGLFLLDPLTSYGHLTLHHKAQSLLAVEGARIYS